MNASQKWLTLTAGDEFEEEIFVYTKWHYERDVYLGVPAGHQTKLWLKQKKRPGSGGPGQGVETDEGTSS